MKNLLNLSLQFHFIPPSFLHFHGYYPKSNSYSLCLGNCHMLSTSFFLYVALRPEDILSLRTYSGSQLPTGMLQLINQAFKLSVIWPQTSFPRLLPLCVVLWNWSSCSVILRHDYVSFCYQNSCLEGGMFQENSIETCILSTVKQITSPGWMHETSARTWCTGKT